MQSIMWPEAPLYVTFHINDICPWTNIPATLHIYVHCTSTVVYIISSMGLVCSKK